MDPDYKSYNSAVEINEEEEKQINCQKLKKIIEEEFNKEIARRHAHLEQIEDQTCNLRKLLHLLRYAAVTSYYKKKELEYNGVDDEASTSDIMVVPDKQNRIHPAVKKLLKGNQLSLGHLNVPTKRQSKIRATHNLTNVKNKRQSENLSDLEPPENKKIKLEEPSTSKQTEDIEKKEVMQLDTITPRRQKRYNILIGNVSQYAPSSDKDPLTHKWVVYVRGPKDEPDISHFVEKVVFYLHESYKPYDVVEVCKKPFQLTRRGWGEFPIRIRIFFNIKQNKPLDLVHHLKLDYTQSGRQMLGGEKLYGIFLYDDNIRSETSNNHQRNVECKTEIEEKVKVEKETEKPSTEHIKFGQVEHDYCLEKVKTDVASILSDHSYFNSSSQQNIPKIKEEEIVQDETNRFIYGIDESYLEPGVNHFNRIVIDGISDSHMFKRNHTVINQKFVTSLPHSNSVLKSNQRNVKLDTSKIIFLSKKSDGLVTNLNQSINKQYLCRNGENNFKISFPQDKFKSMAEVLCNLFKKLPLTSENAHNPIYRRLYPFTASSLKEFASWNVGKQRSSEWSRARTIRRIISTSTVWRGEKWNTKAILMFGRSHNYTPSASYGIFKPNSNEKHLIMSSHLISNAQRKETTMRNMAGDSDIVVDVVGLDNANTSPLKKNYKNRIDISDPNLSLEGSYVRQSALDCNVILRSEEIDEGIMFNGAERMILEATKCLADNLIRRALNHRICQRDVSNSSDLVISSEDVKAAMEERAEVKAISQFQNERRRKSEYFS